MADLLVRVMVGIRAYVSDIIGRRFEKMRNGYRLRIGRRFESFKKDICTDVCDVDI
jgi:hypothetical protein